LNILQKVWELDLAYLDTLAKRLNTSWGYFFHNENQPAYYDANHAHIFEIPAHPEVVIEEVLHFYQERNLTPRFYIYDFEKQASLIEKLSSYHFQVESLISPVQLWNKGMIEHKENGRVSIERVTAENFQEVMAIECSIQEFGGKEVREKAFAEEFKHPSFTHYLLRFDGVACSTACLFQHDDQVRLESVATLEEYRGKGLIGELVSYLQVEVRNRGLENFWVFPINERVEKVYTRYGFDTVAKFTTGHAFLNGKSIKEIQGS
jgi:N-acetylglutamate synthase-like GNAT family acetyltransferase